MKKYDFTRAKLTMTDMDSLHYSIMTDHHYADMAQDKDLFDFSSYDQNHPLYDKSNAKKPGLFKDETGGVPIQQFPGLRSKMYSLKYASVEQKRAKGIIKSVVKKDLRHQNYVDCILKASVSVPLSNIYRLSSKAHNTNLLM
jgi:hypothetical protein